MHEQNFYNKPRFLTIYATEHKSWDSKTKKNRRKNGLLTLALMSAPNQTKCLRMSMLFLWAAMCTQCIPVTEKRKRFSVNVPFRKHCTGKWYANFGIRKKFLRLVRKNHDFAVPKRPFQYYQLNPDAINQNSCYLNDTMSFRSYIMYLLASKMSLDQSSDLFNC